MPLFLLGPLLGFFGKLIGTHLFGGETVLLKLVGGLGWRFFLGLLSSLYFTDHEVRHAIDALFKSVVGAVL